MGFCQGESVYLVFDAMPDGDYNDSVFYDYARFLHYAHPSRVGFASIGMTIETKYAFYTYVYSP